MNNPEPTLIILEGLKGNQPTHMVPLQEALLPHLDALKMAWWIMFFATLAIVVCLNIIRPLLSKKR